MSRTEPNLDWQHQPQLEGVLAELRRTRIGPIFPADPDHKPGRVGTRREARGGKDTKPPYAAHGRRPRRLVSAQCLSCRWSAAGTTWRPVRRRLADHVGKKHPKLAAAS